MRQIDIFLIFIGDVLAVFLAVILLRRRLYKEYPLFITYIASSILSSVARLCVSGNTQTYFKVYWTTEGLYAALALLALYEAFRDVFRIDYEDWPWFRLVFPAAVGILAVSLVGDALLHPPAQAPAMVAVVISFAKVVNFIKGGLFCLFFVLVLLLAHRWQRYPFGIVIGFAVSAAGSALAFAARSVFGTKLDLLAKYGPPVAYILGLLVWIGTCFQPPDTEFQPPRTGILEALGKVNEYSRLLKWITGRR